MAALSRKNIVEDVVDGIIEKMAPLNLAMAVIFRIFNSVNFKEGVSESVLLERIASRIEILLRKKTGPVRANGLNGGIKDVEYNNLDNLVFYFLHFRNKLPDIFENDRNKNVNLSPRTSPGTPRKSPRKSPSKSPRKTSKNTK